MHLLKKTASFLLTLLLFSFVSFMAFQTIPGDSASTMLGTDASAAQIEALRESLGMNLPLFTRYGNWLRGFITGDLGVSFGYKLPVAQIIREKLPITMALSVSAFLMVLIISFPVGIFTAHHAGSFPDTLLMVFNQITMSIPPFFIGILFTFIFGLILHYFVPGKFVSYGENPAVFWKNLFFPALAIALPKSAMTVKMLRNSILSETFKDYFRTATSRGNNKSRALRVHVLRNALIPVITFLAMTFSTIVAGSIIIEQVFVIPGIGRLLLVAISNRDFPIVQTVVMIIAAIVILMNYLADVICQIIDPRTRLY